MNPNPNSRWKKPCRRCGHFHSRHMVIGRRSVKGVSEYRARDGGQWTHDLTTAIQDQCDTWAEERDAA